MSGWGVHPSVTQPILNPISQLIFLFLITSSCNFFITKIMVCLLRGIKGRMEEGRGIVLHFIWWETWGRIEVSFITCNFQSPNLLPIFPSFCKLMLSIWFDWLPSFLFLLTNLPFPPKFYVVNFNPYILSLL